ncbi:glycoside hydrolase family 32 protein [Gramella sp. AN32]|uniref:Glycoside hydrolase family 32 protein n=1 Tax=Christiangramia antarctica TaxID=2058158 RepID=A0ABW5X8Y5_9FLAO|nr:glycoside hydrolase family 32 protein [Gramella sp. AN32]MCM4155477.1 glycosyl hydrolase family 32 [Gramella sp. AN32]
MKYLSTLLSGLLLLCLYACGNMEAEQKDETACQVTNSIASDPYRPNFHFTPKEKWMNDPNGLVYQNGKYHLFFQHYPDSTVWGPMHWGHAVSEDLLNWKEKPIALYPDSLGYIFSGSAVIDEKNTAGFGKNAMVAIFTYHSPEIEKTGSDKFQTQGIAYSLDEGETWKKYEGNPVIENPGIRDFRDPKVFWNKNLEKWQMLLAAKDHIEIFESPDLKNWEKLSDFRFNDQPELGVWECPDLFQLAVENSDEKKWVMIISHGGESSPNGGSGTRYFVGEFDGEKFTTEQKESQWLDYGTDNYAGVSFNNLPDDRRIVIGWMSNWNYATTTPTKAWRSAMTLPRELELVKNNNGYNLKTTPVQELASISENIKMQKNTTEKGLEIKSEELSNSIISFEIENPDGFKVVLLNDSGNSFKMGYENETFYTNRKNSGIVDFNEKFTEKEPQEIPIADMEKMKVKIIIDKSSVEIFLNDGEYAMTNVVYPESPWNTLKIEHTNNTQIKDLKTQKVNLTLANTADETK